jgi:hypothetical protein
MIFSENRVPLFRIMLYDGDDIRRLCACDSDPLAPTNTLRLKQL